MTRLVTRSTPVSRNLLPCVYRLSKVKQALLEQQRTFLDHQQKWEGRLVALDQHFAVIGLKLVESEHRTDQTMQSIAAPVIAIELGSRQSSNVTGSVHNERAPVQQKRSSSSDGDRDNSERDVPMSLPPPLLYLTPTVDHQWIMVVLQRSWFLVAFHKDNITTVEYPGAIREICHGLGGPPGVPRMRIPFYNGVPRSVRIEVSSVLTKVHRHDVTSKVWKRQDELTAKLRTLPD